MSVKRKSTGEQVTLQTIADKLGVSRTTVSNAFGKPDQLTPRLRTKILKMADDLGYCGPDPAARTLRSGKSGAYGLVMTERLSYAVTDPAALLLIQGVAQVFDEREVGLLILPVGPDRTKGVAAVQYAVVDGFLLNSLGEDDPRLHALLARNVPTVIVDEPHHPKAAFIGLDERTAARQAAEHLISLGHRRFGVITFPLAEDDYSGLVSSERLAHSTLPVSRDRLLGFADAVGAVGIAWGEVPVWECALNSAELAATGAGALLDTADRPTAILTDSDLLALGAVAAARTRGLSIPRDLSIIGFDDIPEAETADPPLTTVRQPLREKGVIAARLLLDGWDGPPPVHILPTELIVRASTGPAPITERVSRTLAS